MYLAIDLGGSKTLLAVFDKSGKVLEEYKFPTNEDYKQFLADLDAALTQHLAHHKFIAAAMAVPGQIDPGKTIVRRFGNLDWRDIPIKKDIEKILNYIPLFLDNDAKVAGLSEAETHKQFRKLLYITVSTGIGVGLIVDGKIDTVLADSEPGQMMLDYDGKIQKWEDISSGRALVKRYGKKASEIEDSDIWKEFAKPLALGLNELIAVLQPNAIVVGGGVGAHFEKFSMFLKEELAKLENEMVRTPPVIKASRPEEAVIYGCYQLIKQNVK
jgi:glucokinase